MLQGVRGGWSVLRVCRVCRGVLVCFLCVSLWVVCWHAFCGVFWVYVGGVLGCRLGCVGVLVVCWCVCVCVCVCLCVCVLVYVCVLLCVGICVCVCGEGLCVCLCVCVCGVCLCVCVECVGCVCW